MNINRSAIKESLLGILRQSDRISLKDVRLSKCVYFSAYALELMLFSARGLFLPMGGSLGPVSGWTIAQICHGIASLVFMLLWKDNFKVHIRVAVAIMVFGFVPFAFLPYGYARLAFGVVFYIGLGGAVTSARCGFAFALNNSERFIGMTVVFFVVALFKAVNSLGAEGIIVTYIIPFALLAGLCVCLLRFTPEDFQVKEATDRKDEKGLFWALAFFILYFSVDGYRARLVNSGERAYLVMCIGMLIAGALLFLMLAVFKLATLHIWNLFFVFCIVMGIITGFTANPETDVALNLFGGLTFIGWPLCIYTLGCAQRQFASYALMKKCTVIFVIASPLTTVSSDLLETVFPNQFNMISMVYLVAVSVVLLMLSPYSNSDLFSAVWIKDITKPDMKLLEDAVESGDKFEGFDLTPRQKEVAILLLAAKTRRQIAGEFGISESTVKMHISDLYRKLGINSKAELFKIFGVSEINNVQ